MVTFWSMIKHTYNSSSMRLYHIYRLIFWLSKFTLWYSHNDKNLIMHVSWCIPVIKPWVITTLIALKDLQILPPNNYLNRATILCIINTKEILFVKHLFIYIFMWVFAHVHSMYVMWHTCEGQRSTCRNQFLHIIMCVPRLNSGHQAWMQTSLLI